MENNIYQPSPKIKFGNDAQEVESKTGPIDSSNDSLNNGLSFNARIKIQTKNLKQKVKDASQELTAMAKSANEELRLRSKELHSKLQEKKRDLDQKIHAKIELHNASKRQRQQNVSIPQPESIKYCHICGYEVGYLGKFCPSCGSGQ